MDQVVSAEIPPHPNFLEDPDTEIQQKKRDQADRLRAIVLKNMVHGPCGKAKCTALCMYNAAGEITDVCHKRFPKKYLPETLWDEQQSYAQYKRRKPEDGGGEALHNRLNNQ